MAKQKKALTQRDRVLVALAELGHPTRLLCLEAMAEKPSSPVDVAKANPDYTLGTISYHVRAMSDTGLIKLRRTTQVRGAIAHYYGVTAKGRRVLDTVIAE